MREAADVQTHLCADISDMKTKPTDSRSSAASSSAPLVYTDKSSVRTSLENSDCYAIDLTVNSIGSHVAVLTVPSTIQLFDASTLKRVSALSSTSNNFDSADATPSITISAVQFAYVSPHTLFASTNKNLVLVWDTRTPQQETFQLNGCADEHNFLSIACNNEDLLVAAGTELKGEENCAVAFWDLRAPISKQLLGYYTESHSDDIVQVQFCRINSKLISGSTDGLVCLYDVGQPTEDDALEQIYNANGPVAKCGFAQHNTIYAITASNAFYIWSTSDDNQQIIVQGDTDSEILAAEIPSEPMETSLKSPTVVHHLPSTHSTIVDVLADSKINNLLPAVLPETNSSWPLLMCDHMGKMNITLVSADQREPTILPLHSPHSETIRAARAYQSSLYSCSDDGQLVRWQPPSADNVHKNQQSSNSTKKKPNNRKPY